MWKDKEICAQKKWEGREVGGGKRRRKGKGEKSRLFGQTRINRIAEMNNPSTTKSNTLNIAKMFAGFKLMAIYPTTTKAVCVCVCQRAECALYGQLHKYSTVEKF